MVKRHTKTRKGNIKTQKKTRVLRGGSMTWNGNEWQANPDTESNRAQARFWNNLARLLGVGDGAQDLLDYVNDLHRRNILTGARFNDSGRVIPGSLGSVNSLRALVSNAITDLANRVTSTTSADFQSLVRLRNSLNRQVRAREAMAQKHSNENEGHRVYRETLADLRDMVDQNIQAIEASRARAEGNRAQLASNLQNETKFPSLSTGLPTMTLGAGGGGSGGGGAWSRARSTKTSAPTMTLVAGSASNNKVASGSGNASGSLHRALLVDGQRQRGERPTLHNSNSFWDESYGMHYTNNNRKPPPPGYEGGKRKTRRRKHKKKRTIKKRRKKRKHTKRRRKH